jgi:hypothetical protein
MGDQRSLTELVDAYQAQLSHLIKARHDLDAQIVETRANLRALQRTEALLSGRSLPVASAIESLGDRVVALLRMHGPKQTKNLWAELEAEGEAPLKNTLYVVLKRERAKGRIHKVAHGRYAPGPEERTRGTSQRPSPEGDSM